MTIGAREKVPVQPHGERQRRQSGGLPGRSVAEHHGVVQVIFQLVVQPAVGLVRALDPDDAKV